MTNHAHQKKLLIQAIHDNGMNIEDFHAHLKDKLKISRSTLFRRMEKPTSFKGSEIAVIIKLLKLSDKQVIAMFVK